MPRETLSECPDSPSTVEVTWGSESYGVQLAVLSRARRVTHTEPASEKIDISYREAPCQVPDTSHGQANLPSVRCEQSARWQVHQNPNDLSEFTRCCPDHLLPTINKPQRPVAIIDLSDRYPLAEPVELPFAGYYASMSRHNINDLIRVLRRARDAAFGSDA